METVEQQEVVPVSNDLVLVYRNDRIEYISRAEFEAAGGAA